MLFFTIESAIGGTSEELSKAELLSIGVQSLAFDAAETTLAFIILLVLPLFFLVNYYAVSDEANNHLIVSREPGKVATVGALVSVGLMF